MTHVEQFARDQNGRWRRGVSGNPTGRPRGSKNRAPRRRAGDREHAAEWAGRDWLAFYGRVLQDAEGRLDEKRGAALGECIGVWLMLNPPRQRPGLCSQCGGALDVPVSSVHNAPVRLDGGWVHWRCAPWFLRARWDAAKVALQRLGITGQAF